MDIQVEFRKATNRKTEAYWLTVGRTSMLISYETIVAFKGPDPNGGFVRFRRDNTGGPATEKHMNECDVRGHRVAINEEHFNQQLQLSLKYGINPMLVTWDELHCPIIDKHITN